MSKRRMGYLLEDGKIITLEEHDAKKKAELIDDLEQKLRFWENKENPIPEYVWDSINAMKEQK